MPRGKCGYVRLRAGTVGTTWEQISTQEFAANYRVRTRRDSCDEEIIPGKPRKEVRPEDRSHIYDHADGAHFGLYLTLPDNPEVDSRKATAFGRAASFRCSPVSRLSTSFSARYCLLQQKAHHV